MSAIDMWKEKMTGRERRIHPRIRDNGSVVVTILSAPEAPSLVKKVFFCTTEDLSLSGMRFHAPADVPVNTRLEMRVAVKNPTGAYKHVGRVVWVKVLEGAQPYAVGVQFTDSTATTLSAWKDLVTMKLVQAAQSKNRNLVP